MANRSSESASERAGFGVMLRGLRERALVSQEQLAERSGLSLRAIGNLEQGRVARPRGESVRLLADALGLEGPERARFEEAARPPAGSAGSWSAPDHRAPCLLPPEVADFTGRAEQVEWLRELLTAPAVGASPPAVVVSAVAGKAGVGKTALAMHVAHQLRGRFPDGQLYVNLRGAEQHPLQPAAVLARFLRALGVDGSVVPQDQEERAALYRARLADRRVLVLLDNAATEAQVRPLLPGTPGCAVLVTSRSRLAGLEGAQLLDLDVLEEGQAVELLARIIGVDRVAADSEAAGAIVGYCGQLPLAIRIAGTRLAARPQWSLAQLAGLLADERRRLDELAAGDLEVRASLALSYRALSADQQRAFRLLGVLNALDFEPWVVAALLDERLERAEELIEALFDAQLLQAAGTNQGGRARYRFHDLVRLFAHERVMAEEAARDRSESLGRALGGWLALAELAADQAPDRTFRLVHGTAPRWRPDRAVVHALMDDPLGWFAAERPVLISAVEQAAAIGQDELAWDLAGCLMRFFAAGNLHEDWQHTNAIGLAAARRARNLAGQAAMLRALGDLHCNGSRLDEALGCLNEALSLSREVGDRVSEVGVLEGIAITHQMRGQLDRALASAKEALAIHEHLGDDTHASSTLFVLSSVYLEQGHPDGQELLERALVGLSESGDRHTEAQAWRRLGELYEARGQLDRAAAHFGRCLTLQHQIDNPIGVAIAHRALGEVELRRGRTQEARVLLQQALAAFQELGYRHGQALTFGTLGELCAAGDNPQQAIDYLGTAVHIWRDLGRPTLLARTLMRLGDAYATVNDRASAQQAWDEARDIFVDLGVPEAEAHTGIGG